MFCLQRLFLQNTSSFFNCSLYDIKNIVHFFYAIYVSFCQISSNFPNQKQYKLTILFPPITEPPMAKVARLTFVVVDGSTNWVNQTRPNSTRFHTDKLFFEDWLGVSSRCMCICVCVFFHWFVCFFLRFVGSSLLLECFLQTTNFWTVVFFLKGHDQASDMVKGVVLARHSTLATVHHIPLK